MFYVTFRQGSDLSECYATLDVSNYDRARDVALHLWPQEYSMVYSDKQWIDYKGMTQAQKYNLKLITTKRS